MSQTSIGFASKKLNLEGVLTTPVNTSGPHNGLVICHPHPVLGGNMDHPVIISICKIADAHGIATLRFNFRGVGSSEGLFSNGSSEKEDAKSALNVLRRWPNINSKQVAVAGYSFGASILLDGVSHCKEARSLVLISPPVSAVVRSPIGKDKRPKLFLSGQRDKLSPSTDLQRLLDDFPTPVQFREIPGADHTMKGHEAEVAELVVDFVSSAMKP